MIKDIAAVEEIFFSNLASTAKIFQTLDDYKIFLAALQGFKKFAIAQKLEFEKSALGMPNPCVERFEAFRIAEELSEFVEEFQSVCDNRLTLDRIQEAAMDKVHDEEPDLYHRVTRRD